MLHRTFLRIQPAAHPWPGSWPSKAASFSPLRTEQFRRYSAQCVGKVKEGPDLHIRLLLHLTVLCARPTLWGRTHGQELDLLAPVAVAGRPMH